jgi:peptidoglycan/xylan/chitin deacetylase (PgdA/CDA1 family)
MKIIGWLRNTPALIARRGRYRREMISRLCNGLPKKKMAFLTVDLEFFGHPEKTKGAFLDGLDNFLDAVERKNIPVVFFVEGRFALENRDVVAGLSDNGHEVASHGYDHINLGPAIWWNKLQPNTIQARRRSISKNHELLKRITHKRPTSFRAPYFSIDATTLKILEGNGYRVDSSLNNCLFGLPSVPYHPSYGDILSVGDSKILELCCTTSTKSGIKSRFIFEKIRFFGRDDLQKNISITKMSSALSPYTIIGAHQWEFSDKLYDNAYERLEVLSDLLTFMKKTMNVKFATMDSILDS